MSGAAHNSWANAALESPGSALARAQQRRWALDTNDEILAKLNNKLAAMLEGISDAVERTFLWAAAAAAAADQPSFRGLTPFGLCSAALRSPKGQLLRIAGEATKCRCPLENGR